MTPTTNAALADEIERLHEAATPGDWMVSKAKKYTGKVKTVFLETLCGTQVCDFYTDTDDDLHPFPKDKENAALSAFLRNKVPVILSALRSPLPVTAEDVGEMIGLLRNLNSWGERMNANGEAAATMLETVSLERDAAVRECADEEQRRQDIERDRNMFKDRANAAEAALALAREGLEKAAQIVRGEVIGDRYVRWPSWNTGNVDQEGPTAQLTRNLARQIEALTAFGTVRTT